MTIFDHLTGILAGIEAIPGKIAATLSGDLRALDAKVTALVAKADALALQIEALIGKPDADDQPAPSAQEAAPAPAAQAADPAPVPPVAPQPGA
ncbi:MAG: hypothetical protein KGL63_01775 [Betaproteobacteria bacterium]|nr:hypothetical protein [Betaproteobacteria bacterium]